MLVELWRASYGPNPPRFEAVPSPDSDEEQTANDAHKPDILMWVLHHLLSIKIAFTHIMSFLGGPYSWEVLSHFIVLVREAYRFNLKMSFGLFVQLLLFAAVVPLVYTALQYLHGKNAMAARILLTLGSCFALDVIGLWAQHHQGFSNKAWAKGMKSLGNMLGQGTSSTRPGAWIEMATSIGHEIVKNRFGL